MKLAVIRTLFLTLVILQGCSTDPLDLELIQRPLTINITIFPNFSVEFVEDRPVDVSFRIENRRVDLENYTVRVLRALTREPVQLLEGDLAPTTDQFDVTLAPLKAGLYTVIVTIGDINDFQSASTSNVNIPPQAFQEDYDDIWFLGAANQWQGVNRLNQIGNHLWEIQCVPFEAGDSFLLTSSLGFRECFWGGNVAVADTAKAITLAIACDSTTFIDLEKSVANIELPAGNYDLRFDDVTNEIAVFQSSSTCQEVLGLHPLRMEGSAVIQTVPGIDHLLTTNVGQERTYFFGAGSMQFVSTDGSNAALGDDNNDGVLEVGGAPISIEPGLKHVFVNEETLAYRITEMSTVSVVGDLDWSLDQQLVPDPEKPWIFRGTAIPLERGNMRFRANNGWGISWGDAEQNTQLIFNGGNIPTESRSYDIGINTVEMIYYIR